MSQPVFDLMPPSPGDHRQPCATGRDLCVVLGVTELHFPGVPPRPEHILGPVSPAREEPKEEQVTRRRQDSETRVTVPGASTGERGLPGCRAKSILTHDQTGAAEKRAEA